MDSPRSLSQPVDEDWPSSEALCLRLRTWFKKGLIERLEPGGKLMVVGTRWYFADLYAELRSPRDICYALSLSYMTTLGYSLAAMATFTAVATTRNSKSKGTPYTVGPFASIRARRASVS
jgi:hypothetical protein